MQLLQETRQTQPPQLEPERFILLVPTTLIAPVDAALTGLATLPHPVVVFTVILPVLHAPQTYNVLPIAVLLQPIVAFHHQPVHQLPQPLTT